MSAKTTEDANDGVVAAVFMLTSRVAESGEISQTFGLELNWFSADGEDYLCQFEMLSIENRSIASEAHPSPYFSLKYSGIATYSQSIRSKRIASCRPLFSMV